MDKQIPGPCVEQWLGELAPAQQSRIQRLKAEQRRAASLAALQLLKQACRTLGIERFDLRDLHFPPKGKPFWGTPLDFNISHSHQLVACAATTACRVGIDVEHIRPYHFPIVERVLDRGEQSRVEQDKDAFFDIWTAKEAVVKACGHGIGSLGRVHTDPDGAQFDNQRWHLKPLALGNDYRGHLAVEAKAEPVVMEALSADELCEASLAAQPQAPAPDRPPTERV
jgi:4'-phosphopantetheinyl transferase